MSQPIDIADIDENPNQTEFERLEEVMRTMVKFYENGRDTKKAQWETSKNELET